MWSGHYDPQAAGRQKPEHRWVGLEGPKIAVRGASEEDASRLKNKKYGGVAAAPRNLLV